MAEVEAEEDAFNNLDKQNDMLEKQLKKELEKEEAHLAKEKKKWKDQQVTKGWDKPDKFDYDYPNEPKEEKEGKKSLVAKKKKSKKQKAQSLVQSL
jgi:hypothetical protein